MTQIFTSRSALRLIFAASGALLVTLALGGHALATTQKSAERSGKKLPSKIMFIDSSSSETPAERQKRLKIECKGRPNAGACLGMTK